MAKIKLNPQTDKPTSKLQLSKDFMSDYLIDKSIEEQDWYMNLYDNNTKDGVTDWKVIREEFAKKYFDYLNEKKSTLTYREQLLKKFNRV